MYKGKFSKNNKRRLTPWAALALALVLALSVGGTIAYLVANANSITNTFTPSNVDCEVVETFDGTTKTDVSIKNTGDVDAYIRATVVVNWVDANGNICINHSDVVTITPEAGWAQSSDGYYYYTDIVEPSTETNELISNSIQLSQANDGCKMQVTILGQAIQADGIGKDSTGAEKKPVELAWGVDPSLLK